MAFSWHSKLQKYEIANYAYIIHCFHMVAGWQSGKGGLYQPTPILPKILLWGPGPTHSKAVCTRGQNTGKAEQGIDWFWCWRRRDRLWRWWVGNGEEVSPRPSRLEGLGERRKLTQRGLGRSPGRKIWCISALKYDIWWQQFSWFSWESTYQISCSLNSSSRNIKGDMQRFFYQID